jgi:hypothetical protein
MRTWTSRIICGAFAVLVTSVVACSANDVGCWESGGGCSCKAGNEGSLSECSVESESSGASTAVCCAQAGFPDEEHTVCDCTPVGCRDYGVGGCSCMQGDLGTGASVVSSCTPTTGQKCCKSNVTCTCDERAACDSGTTEVASCSASDLATCDAGYTKLNACLGGGGVGPGTKPNPTPTLTQLDSWAIGTWFAPAYDDDDTNKHIPAKGLGLKADGTYSHNVSGVVDDEGTWTITGDTVTLSKHGALDRSRNCGFVNYDDGNRVDTYYRDDAPKGCPDAIAPLSSVEKCLVGVFGETTNQNLATTIFKWTRTDFRNMIFDQIYTGNGDASITAIYHWSVADGKLCTEGVDRQSGCQAIDWDEVDRTRKGTKDPGCVEP